jgi:NAD(P)-dependent dehydrogenase (short-subunit alcohol dehydrogenase family)
MLTHRCSEGDSNLANVLITGASSGIGLATALELGRAGHTVFATMRDPARVAQLKDIGASEGLSVHLRTLDVDSDDSVRACFNDIAESVDVLVNNAGMERHGSIEELPMEAFIGTMNTNYLGAVRCMKAVLPHMVRPKMAASSTSHQWPAGSRAHLSAPMRLPSSRWRRSARLWPVK